jgi:hypothetical protein
MEARDMTDPRPASAKVRKACFEYWKVSVDGYYMLPCKCPDCKGALFNPANTRWDAEHRIVREHGGSDDPPNVRPLKYACHKIKTADDLGRLAKSRRQGEKTFGVRRSKGFYRPKGIKFDWGSGRYRREEGE